jgi:hypothetical protein
LPLEFAFLAGFCCPIDNIRIMGVLFGSNSFSSSFLQKALDENVHHVGVLPRLRDVQVTFGILS